MKHLLNILFVFITTAAVIAAAIGSLKSHSFSMTTESHIYYAEDVVLTRHDRQWTPPATVPEIRLSSYQTFTNEEIYLLSQLAMAESRGEDAIGQALVIRTVLNRCEKYGKSIEEVIYARGQFATGTIGTYEPNENNLKAIRMVIYEDWDESEGCLYFSADGYNGPEPLFVHQHHYFSK